MPYRWITLRFVDPDQDQDFTRLYAISLYRAALAAAEETLQNQRLSVPWLNLFREHLSNSDPTWLRWAGDMAESAEIRRAYSALYGRYFTKALLSERCQIENFMSLRNPETTLQDGITVKRVQKGDIPDWVAWDSRNRAICLAEAKGRISLGRNIFLQPDPPAVVQEGKQQFSRVDILDSNKDRIASKNWLVANLWCTDVRPEEPVATIWDPVSKGRILDEQETSRAEIGVRKRWAREIALNLGEARASDIMQGEISAKDSAFRVTIDPTPNAQPPRIPVGYDLFAYEGPQHELPSSHQHSGTYVLGFVSPFGIFPIRNKSDLEYVESQKNGLIERDVPSMIVGLSTTVLEAQTYHRQDAWVSDNGLVSENGLAIFDATNARISDPDE